MTDRICAKYAGHTGGKLLRLAVQLVSLHA
jgi:hypothetical protein